MGPFEHLMQAWPGRSPGEQQRLAEREFALLVQNGNLRYWRPGNEIPERGTRILIGVGTYFVADMRLLDVLDASLSQQPPAQRGRIDVFSVAEIQGMAGFDQYFPGAVPKGDIPFVGIWEDGVMQQYGWGAEGRDMLIGLYPALKDVNFCDWW